MPGGSVAGSTDPPATEPPTNAAPPKGRAKGKKGEGAEGPDEALAQAEVERILNMRRRKWAVAEEVRILDDLLERVIDSLLRERVMILHVSSFVVGWVF